MVFFLSYPRTLHDETYPHDADYSKVVYGYNKEKGNHQVHELI